MRCTATASGPESPFPALLCPSWLLAGYDLQIGEPVTACGRDGDRPARLTEFRSLTVDPVIDPARFTAPPGAVFGEPHGQLFGPFGLPFNGPAWQVAKNAAGLAAGGIGAGLRYSPFGPFGPFGRRPPYPDPDDAEAAMPHDDPAPGEAAADAVKRRVDDKVTAARGFLGSLLGGKPPGPPGGTV